MNINKYHIGLSIKLFSIEINFYLFKKTTKPTHIEIGNFYIWRSKNQASLVKATSKESKIGLFSGIVIDGIDFEGMARYDRIGEKRDDFLASAFDRMDSWVEWDKLKGR